MDDTSLRLANKSDVQLIFNWANDDLVRENSLHKDKIKWDNHIIWFRNKLLSNETFIFILEEGSSSIGQIRFDKEKDYYTVDYSVDKHYRGKGFGQKILIKSLIKIREIEDYDITIKAIVLKSNISSQKVFQKVGFTEDINLGNDLFIHFQLKTTN